MLEKSRFKKSRELVDKCDSCKYLMFLNRGTGINPFCIYDESKPINLDKDPSFSCEDYEEI